MTRAACCLPMLFSILPCLAAGADGPPPLCVSPSGRYLQTQEGKPFFYLGDTAWELFHRLDRQEADLYLEDRARKGFTVIQAVVLAELDGLNTPNANGDRPLEGNDPGRPNEAYFRHVDTIVDKAQSLGLYMGMLPTWGDKWNKKWGVGPEIFTPENAAAYGEFLGRRYRDKPIIWILGGDRSPDTEQHLAIVRAMAAGLGKGDGGNHLATYHPQGGNNSAQWFHGDDWLDFNMFQSGHSEVNLPNYRTTLDNYRRTPVKPTLDGEPRYEDHPINWKPANGWFDEYDVRQAAYWSTLSGACGHTYGDHNIWQMWQQGRAPISSARTPWRQALDHPASAQMGHMRRLLESCRFHELEPDPALLADPAGEGAEHVSVARTADRQLALVYLPTGRPVEVYLGMLAGKAIEASWFDPRTGTTSAVGDFPPVGTQRFEPRESGRGHDVVLVLRSRL
ncbi:MAG: glycoside hydrolase family 140 protein [Thermoguttaceae bacterium]